MARELPPYHFWGGDACVSQGASCVPTLAHSRVVRLWWCSVRFGIFYWTRVCPPEPWQQVTTTKAVKKNWGEQSNAYSLFFFCANVIFSCSTLETLFYPEIVANQLSFWKKWPLYMFTFWHTSAAFLNTATQIRSVQKRDSPGNLLIWPDSDESRTFSRTRQPSGENECHFSS